MKEKFSLKDALFNPEKVHQLATEIKAVYAELDQEGFEKEIIAAFPKLELKERIDHIRNMLYKYLPTVFEEAIDIIVKALPDELNTNKYDNDFGDFIYAPYAAYIATLGCTDEHLDLSLSTLRELTKRFSVEFAIRDFINHYPEETLVMLDACSRSDNYHERRLASEGLRPKLPWAKKLTIDYTTAVQLLDNLFDDKTRYVTRSVANHMNDVSKIDANLVLEVLKRWKASKKQESREMAYIISHALRTLVKQGNEEALQLLGYPRDPKIKVRDFKLYQEVVKVGEALLFDFSIEAKSECQLLLDYIVYFQTKSGKLSPKVHKIKKISMKEGESVKISKKHPFRANMSTRKFYVGEHKVELQINGKCYASCTFTLYGIF